MYNHSLLQYEYTLLISFLLSMNRLLIFTMLSTKYLLTYWYPLATFLLITWATVVLFSRTSKSLKSLCFDLELGVWTPWVLLNLQLKHVSKLLLKCWLLLSSDLNGFFLSVFPVVT